jgi:hypothetical protein
VSKAQESRNRRAEKALIASMGEKPNRLVPGSLEVEGGSLISWTESCRAKGARSDVDACHHARYGSASREALDAFFDAWEVTA